MTGRTEPLRLWFPGLLLPGLNGPDGLMRGHRHGRGVKAAKTRLGLLIRSQGFPVAMSTPVALVYERRYVRLPMDWANAAASIKHLEDAVVAAGYLPDDSPKYVTGLHVIQTKVPGDQAGTSLLIVPHDADWDWRCADCGAPYPGGGGGKW